MKNVSSQNNKTDNVKRYFSYTSKKNDTQKMVNFLG